MKEFKIKYNGIDAKLVLNDQPDGGTILKVLRPPIMTFKPNQAMPDINLEEYLMYLATNMVVEAPWPKQNVTAIRSLPKDTFFRLCEILGNEYPLNDFLSPAARLTFGKLLDESTSPSQTESTTSSSNSDTASDKSTKNSAGSG